MEIQTILTIVMLTILVAFFVGIFFFFRNYLKLQQERLYMEQRNKDYEMRRMEEEMYNSRNSRKQEESESRYLPRLMEEIPYLVEKAVNKSQRRDYNELSKMIDYNLQNISDKIKDININEEYNSNSKQLIKEISHSLNTPFSLIEVTTDNLLGESELSSQTLESLNTIKSSINICKSFLASFRELTLIASSSTIWNPESLVEAIDSAISIYKQKNEKANNTIVELPENIEGFSNNYILSLLLPLAENAIESAIVDTDIKISHGDCKMKSV